MAWHFGEGPCIQIGDHQEISNNVCPPFVIALHRSVAFYLRVVCASSCIYRS